VDKINSKKHWIRKRKLQQVDEVVDLQEQKGVQEIVEVEEIHARKYKSRITI
jgi:hypothetical protein